MEKSHRFEDEWLLNGSVKLAGLTPELISEFRRQKKPSLADALVLVHPASGPELAAALKKAYGIIAVEPAKGALDKLALSLVPETLCRRHRLIPLKLNEETIELAMSNPLDVTALHDVELLTGRRPVARYCRPECVQSLLSELFNPDNVVHDILAKIGESEAVEVLEEEEAGEKAEEEAEEAAKIDAPVIQLVNSIISKGIGMRASDIHIEHDELTSHVRYRIDGTLRSILSVPHALASGPLVSRIKIMADLDVSEHRRPQDGRAKLRIGGVEIGLRVSTLPTQHGEKIVIRVLDERSAKVPLEDLGFNPELAARLQALLRAAQGIFLVTGPTGSGKTTTLYALLNKLKSEDVNITTIEDPIEYKIEGLNQVQIEEKQGLTFPAVLRSVLRQDPDIIMVGEIRDPETADIAFQSAQTGHLVLSTLHTNDTIATVSRLADMGLERFKIASGLLGITAQRLVRRLCLACREAVPRKDAEAEVLPALKREKLSESYFRPRGCAACGQTGYKGRISLLEFFETTQDMKDAVAAGSDEGALKEAALAAGSLHTLRHDALWHLSQGDTSLEEILPYVSLAEAGKFRGRDRRKEGTPRRILIVDDNAELRRSLRSLLEAERYLIEEAGDGLQALARIRESPPDLMLLDLNMPNMDGYVLIRLLRGEIGMPNFHIMVMTTRYGDKTHEEVLRLGADDYIEKLASPTILLARVNAAFRRLRA